MGITRKPLSLAKTSKKITKLSTTDYDQYLMAADKSRKASLDPGDWRTHLHSDTRRRIVNRIINALKKSFPFSGLEGLYQLERTAARVEEEEYAAATSQSGYLHQVALKLLSMEPNTQRVPYLFPFINAGNFNRFPNSALGSTMQTGDANGGDWQEEIYQKIKAMKEIYLLELIEMNLEISTKLLLHDLLPQQQAFQHVMELRIRKSMLERILVFLQVPKDSILPYLKEKLGSFQMQIINLINANRRRQPVFPLQQRLLQFHMHPIQRPLPRNLQMQSRNMQGSVPTMPWNNMTSLRHISISCIPRVQTAQQNMILQVGPSLNNATETFSYHPLLSNNGGTSNRPLN